MVCVSESEPTDELDPDEYMTDRFESEFGFTVNERRMPEIDTQPEPIPITELLKDFSMWENWYDSAIAKCVDLEIESAASAVVFSFLRFTPERCNIAEKTSLRFIGNFDWPENSAG